jgi:DeoR/GlpR family transcriptional regulator of sugar metabolism
MLTSQRKQLIAARLERDGQIVASELAVELGLSEDTIRRDLREMAGEGLLKRVHGGALPLAGPLPDFTERRAIATEEKRALGRRGAQLVREGQLVFLDGGTTNAELARALPRDLRVTIATHSPTIAAELEHHAAEVILVGGKIYKHSMVAAGAMAMETISRLSPDLFFMGVTALHPEFGLLTGDAEEAAIKRLISARAAETWVMATKEKFAASSPVRVIGLVELSGLIVSSDAGDLVAPYRELGVEVIEAA